MLEINLDSAFPMCLSLSCGVALPTPLHCLSWMMSLMSSRARQDCGAKAMRDTSILILGIYLAHFSIVLNDFSGITAMEQSLEL